MDFLAVIRRESDRFYDVAASADPVRPVPGCPGWTIADLVWHLGETHWFWATDIETRATSPEHVEDAKPARPGTHSGLIAWGRGQADRLVEVLSAAADTERVWTWAMDERDHNVGFIRRHQVQEAAVHRWDIERAATGDAAPIEADVAADSIDEVLAITLPWGVGPEQPLAGSAQVRCADADGEWFIRADGRVERANADADVALHAAASDLLLALYERVPLDEVEVTGDASIAADLVRRINTA